MSKPELTEMDIYCIARLIQNSFQAPTQEGIKTYRPLYGCMYCKYAKDVCTKQERPNFQKLFMKLEELTGVDISTCIPEPERIGMAFLPASHYIEHPEDFCYLERIHDHDTVEKIKACLRKVTARSRESDGQRQGNALPVGNQKDAHTGC